MAEKVVAMILAGGKGTRLEALTKKVAKPAVSFAAKYHIIDFPLSNCANSGINTVGVLTQYESNALDSYLGNGEKWGLNGVHSLMSSLQPRQTEEGANWYEGTADAIAQNIDFLDANAADYVLILSGDHIYKTTYTEMIKTHINTNADATISVMEVPMAEAPRFGIMATNEKDRIVEFQEKPKKPKSNLASMGVYVFSWKVLRSYLVKDMKDPNSEHDFGKNIIPNMLNDGKRMQAYRFKGYWKDVGTLASLHEANMDIAFDRTELDVFEKDSPTTIYTEDTYSAAQFYGPKASVKQSIVNQGAAILGDVYGCVISSDVIIDEGAKLNKCVVMAGVEVGKDAVIENAILAPNVKISEGAQVNVGNEDIILVAKDI